MAEITQSSTNGGSSGPKPVAVIPARVSVPLTTSQIAIVKSTAPLLKQHGESITTLFYGNMLKAHPELNNIFNHTSQTTGAQPRALAAAVFAYASYVDDLGQLTAAVERIAHKHVSLTVQPDQYPIVGKYLIEAVAAVLGDAVTPEVAEAWTAAYAALADIFINRERELYTAFENWKGYRRFRIQRKVAESSQITSFYLVPEDGQPLPLFKPGQYVSLQMFVPKFGYMQPRQYSLSDAPRSDYYRISVKKESGKEPGHPGWISHLLHENYTEGDIVELTHPTGEFFIEPQADDTAPLILISAGVGITPMISILGSLVASHSSRPVSWIHGSHSSEVQAFGKHVQEVCNEKLNVKSFVFRTSVAEEDVQGVNYHFNGRVDLEKLDQKGDLFFGDPTAQYFVCGPVEFMYSAQKYLLKSRVNDERVHLEIFGTGDGA